MTGLPPSTGRPRLARIVILIASTTCMTVVRSLEKQQEELETTATGALEATSGEGVSQEREQDSSTRAQISSSLSLADEHEDELLHLASSSSAADEHAHNDEDKKSCTFSSFASDFCLSAIDDSFPGLMFEILIFFYAFGGLAVAADHLCNAMETLCDHLKLREDVGGATFMALGGAIPEICISTIVSLKTALSSDHQAGPHLHDHQHSEVALGVGAILGSGLIAFCVIPSICVFFAEDEDGSCTSALMDSSSGPMTTAGRGSISSSTNRIVQKALLSLKRRPFIRDVVAYLTCLGALVFVVERPDGVVTTWCAGLFLLCYAVYLATIVLGRTLRRLARRVRGSQPLLDRQMSSFRERALSRTGTIDMDPDELPGVNRLSSAVAILPSSLVAEVDESLNAKVGGGVAHRSVSIIAMQKPHPTSPRAVNGVTTPTKEGEHDHGAAEVLNPSSRSSVSSSSRNAVSRTASTDGRTTLLSREVRADDRRQPERVEQLRTTLKRAISSSERLGSKDGSSSAHSLSVQDTRTNLKVSKASSSPPKLEQGIQPAMSTSPGPPVIMASSGTNSPAAKWGGPATSKQFLILPQPADERVEAQAQAGSASQVSTTSSSRPPSSSTVESATTSLTIEDAVMNMEERERAASGLQQVSTNIFSGGLLQREQEEEEQHPVVDFEERISNIAQTVWAPVIKVSDTVCPDCRIFEAHENLWPVTFLAALTLIALWSSLVTTIVSRWVHLIHGGEATLSYLGVVLVAIGAEIPDCVQSVQAARRGLGSMAIASCWGAQTLNICIGLGLPWMIVALVGKPIVFDKHSTTGLKQTMVAVFIAVSGIFIAAVGPLVLGYLKCSIFNTVMNPSSAASYARIRLGRGSATFSLTLYFMICIVLGILTFCPTIATSSHVDVLGQGQQERLVVQNTHQSPLEQQHTQVTSAESSAASEDAPLYL
ncbi:unnamed protein product [Amoebophrya sp. A25]|nr:unnamed protein product [Amoebophrya sp. A25]|eukprot:GSA25T00014691001.1